MASKVISIELGQILTKISEVTVSGKSVKVQKCAVIETPPNVVADGMPNTQDKQLETAIRQALSAHKMKAKKVMFSVMSAKIAIREIRIPAVKENRIWDVVHAKAAECFPVDLSDYKVTYSVLGKVEDDKGNQNYKILVLAAPNTLLLAYYELAKQCGMEVAGIDYMGNSLYQAVKKSTTTETQLVVKIDERFSLLAVMKGGELVSIRNMTYGVDDIVRAYMAEYQSGDITYSGAISILQTKEYELDRFLVEGQGVQNFDNRREAMESLIKGIARVADFYNSQNQDSPIERICLTGLGGNFRGLDKLVEQNLGISTQALDSVEGVVLPKDFDASGLGDYITCIGATIKPLDFLVKSSKDKKKKEGAAETKEKGKTNAVALLIFVGGVLVAVALAVISTLSYNEALDEKNRLTRRLEELRPVEEVHNTYLAAQGLWTDANNMYQLTENHNDHLVRFIQELEQKMPSDIVVLSMTASADNVVLNVDVRSKESAAKVLQELRAFESIAVVNTSGITDVEDDYGQHLVSFSVSCIYQEEENENVEE